MKNKLTDLNDHLFAQLERLQDEDLQPEQLTTEIQRARATANIARQIVDGARLSLDAVKLAKGYQEDTGEQLVLPNHLGVTYDQ